MAVHHSYCCLLYVCGLQNKLGMHTRSIRSCLNISYEMQAICRLRGNSLVTLLYMPPTPSLHLAWDHQSGGTGVGTELTAGCISPSGPTPLTRKRKPTFGWRRPGSASSGLGLVVYVCHQSPLQIPLTFDTFLTSLISSWILWRQPSELHFWRDFRFRSINSGRLCDCVMKLASRCLCYV